MPKSKPACPYPVPAVQTSLVLGEELSSPPFSSFLFLTVPLSFYHSIVSYSLLSRVQERNKPAYEINREACDDYKLCERYAMVYGYNAAYNRYFRQRRGARY